MVIISETRGGKNIKNPKIYLKKNITTVIIGFIIMVLIGIAGCFLLNSEQQERTAMGQGSVKNLMSHEQIYAFLSSTFVMSILAEISPQTTLSIGDIISFGEYNWRVLNIQDDRALLLSEHVIERRSYHDYWGEAVSWEMSSIRHYLNNQFLNSFNAVDRAKILESRIINNDNPWWFGISGGNDTNDSIFLLSIEEVLRYFGDSGQLWNQYHLDNERWGVSDQYNTARKALDIYGDASWWWLRSPGFGSVFATIIDDNGGLRIYGNFTIIGIGGVRPALWIEL